MVAWFALGVSGLALLWQLIYSLRVDRAALKVSVSQMSMHPGDLHVFAITVTNIGRRATVVQSAHLTLGKPRRVRDRLPAWMRRNHKYAIFAFADTDLSDLNSLKFPQRLDVGDEGSFYIRREHVLKELARHKLTHVHVRASASTARRKNSRPVRVDSAD
ncbi:hypothetical protein JNUCC0626_18100 [Lentzea sp. JNUCC 0626]|uniref:hypothetical protein n=1 Tax=Lentzea sp. JNUCC 0626 TaxID=3367513 RepID=UPI0037490F52